jgi:hypothetical protein
LLELHPHVVEQIACLTFLEEQCELVFFRELLELRAVGVVHGRQPVSLGSTLFQ